MNFRYILIPNCILMIVSACLAVDLKRLAVMNEMAAWLFVSCISTQQMLFVPIRE